MNPNPINPKELPTAFAHEMPRVLRKEVSPATAQKWLATSEGNRNYIRTNIKRFVALMKRGEWNLSETIAFDEDGHLCDGRHRLMAVVESGVTVTMYVQVGMKKDAIKYRDTGKVRSRSDAICFSGALPGETCMKGKTELSDMALYLRSIRNNDGNGRQPPLDVLKSFMEANIGAIRVAWNRYTELRLHLSLSKGVAGALFVIYEADYASPRFDDFCEQVAKGEMLKVGMPAYTLRNTFIRARQERDAKGLGSSHDRHLFEAFYTLKAWLAFVDDKPLYNLRPPRDASVAEALRGILSLPRLKSYFMTQTEGTHK